MPHSNQKNIAVFSGSSEGDGKYVSLANELGKALAKNHFTVVNGGGPGLMDAVAKSAFEEGGKVIGIHFEHEGRLRSKYNTETISYKELLPRQQKIISLADAFVFLPGGLGTFYELTEVMVKKYFDEISLNVPIILVAKEFWEPFLKMINIQEKRKFIKGKIVRSFKIVDNISEVLMEIKQNLENEQVEKQKERWNNRANDWDVNIESPDHYANFENGYQKFINLEKKTLEKIKVVDVAIDLGCGTGQTTSLLVGKANKIYALDIAEEMLKQTLKKVTQAIPLCASATSIPLSKNSVNIAISRGMVVSHLPKKIVGDFFSEIGRIVKPGGQIIFDYLSNPETASYQNQSPKIKFSMEDITNLLKSQGFTDIVFDGQEGDRVVRVTAYKLK